MIKEYTQKSLCGTVVGYLGSARFEEDFDSLEPKERIEAITKMMPYVFKKQATDVNVSRVDEEVMNIFEPVMEAAKRVNK